LSVSERDPYEVLQVSRFAPWRDIRAAYRALARRCHPDGTMPDAIRMVAVNRAFESLEREHRQRGEGSPGVPVGPGRAEQAAPAQPNSTYGALKRRVMAARRVDTPVLDFGQYAGWHIADVAERDPRYLLWLSRHSSGIRFRSAIEQVLGTSPEIGRHAALVR
jgi:curved DNA-binding protein CbpA